LTHDTTSAAAGAGDATLLLALDGLVVTAVQEARTGARVVRVGTADETAAACQPAMRNAKATPGGLDRQASVRRGVY
jgi:hypothetical protein